MADGLAWTFDFTRERVPELQIQLEWALQHQNRRFMQSFVAGTWGVRRDHFFVRLVSFFASGRGSR